MMQNIFPLLSKVLWSRINSCYSKLFSNLKRKEHNIIIIKVICSHMDPMYIETLYNTVYLLMSNKSSNFNIKMNIEFKKQEKVTTSFVNTEVAALSESCVCLNLLIKKNYIIMSAVSISLLIFWILNSKIQKM